MEKGFAHKPGTTVPNSNKMPLMVGAGAAILLLGIGISLHLFLPKESKACALMPGFCKQRDEKSKGPMQVLDQTYHSEPKFGLIHWPMLNQIRR